jgi:hypothetical protein
MDSDRLNRWLTLGANVGVLVGIVLILMELNQNAELMRAQMTQARADNVVESYRDLQHSDHWAKIAAKRRSAKSDEEWVKSLTPEEYERAFYYHLGEYHNLRTQFVQYRGGYLDPQIWETSSRGQIVRLAQAWPYFFEGTPDYVDREFGEYINQVAIEEGLPAFYRFE